MSTQTLMAAAVFMGNRFLGTVHMTVQSIQRSQRPALWACRHVRDNVRGADGRGGADDGDRHGCRVLHRLQGLDAVQHLELLLLQPRLRQQP